MLKNRMSHIYRGINPPRAYPVGRYQAGGLPEIERRPIQLQGHYHGQPNPQLSRGASDIFHQVETAHMETKPSVEVHIPERSYTTPFGLALGAGLLAVGIPVAGILGYKVIRKIGENVFGKKKKEEEE